MASSWFFILQLIFNLLNAELNPVCHLLALLGAHHNFHVSGLRANRSFFVYKLQTVVILCKTGKTKSVTPRIITENFQQLQQERFIVSLVTEGYVSVQTLFHPVDISKAYQKVKYAISFEQLNLMAPELLLFFFLF